MFFQNAMGVQTLMVTHGDNTLSWAQLAAAVPLVPPPCPAPRSPHRPPAPMGDASCTPGTGVPPVYTSQNL